MWIYITLAFIWSVIIFAWLIPVIRQHIVYEIYAAFGLGSSLTLLTLGLGGVSKQLNILLPLRIMGFILYIPAALLVFPTFGILKRKGKPKSGWEHTTVMIDSGVFRIVRHPLYLGGALWTMGLVLIFQSVPSIILGAVGVFCYWMTSREEDLFNIGKFGGSYREYMKKVPRWNVFRNLVRR